jgi:hypothetical protein
MMIKIFGIFCLIFIVLLGVSITIDFFTGDELSKSIMNRVNPFPLSNPLKVIIFSLFFLYYFVERIIKSKKKTMDSNG